MAFELPDHLPKGGFSRDKATQILNNLGQTSFQQLNANLVASWVAELDDAITETKNSIAGRIQQDMPEFERLYQSSTDLQTRLHEITSTVSNLEGNVESPTTGILLKLNQTLSSYSTRERLALETEVTYHAFEQLLHLCLGLQKLRSYMDRGELPESTEICRELDSSILAASVPLQNANIMLDIKKRFRTLRDHVQEQLSDAYDRCISISDPMKLQIHQWTVVSPQSTQIFLSAILASLSQDALASKLASFRRDLLIKIVDPILLPSHAISTSSEVDSSSATLSVISSPQTTSPVQSLRSFTHFLQSHLLLHLPESQSDFSESLYTALGSSLLIKLLQPFIPSSLPAVPAYLATLNDAIDFENEYIAAHSTSSRHKRRQIQEWGDDIATHYEKKRREVFLEKTRGVIASFNDKATFRVEMIVQRTGSPSPLSASTTSVSVPSPSFAAPSPKENREDNNVVADEDNWGFGDDETDTNGMGDEAKTALVDHPSNSNDRKEDEEEKSDDISAEDNWGWGDDETMEEPETESTAEGQENSRLENTETVEQDSPADADNQGVVEISNQEEENIDPWDDDPWAVSEDDPPVPVVEIKPKPSITIVAPTAKTATRLERFSAKSKGQTHNTSGASSPAPSPAPQDTTQFPATKAQVSASTTLKNGKAKSSFPPLAKQDHAPPVKESYLVTVQARRILEIAGETLREGKEMLQTNVFSTTRLQPDKDKLGHLLLSTTSSIIDLYRALYPISQAPLLSKDPTNYMQWSNDCLFLSNEMSNFKFPVDNNNNNFKNEKWLEAQERTQTLGECCFEDAISNTQEVIRALLAEAGGFVNVSEDDLYEKCKDVILRILDELEDTARKWKKILSKSQYFVSAGRIVEDALYRFIDEIISLQDIPQKDSEYISEFCEMMERLEGLFVYSSGEQSVVGVYVSIWFKFSYFSWLVKGSIADISYMFDQGHLIDYEIDELVRLLRALFADTPLRESTIQKFLKGHPNVEAQY